MLLTEAPRRPEGLISLADGWPALLGLAALTNDRDLPHAGMPDELYSYFAEELYQAVPQDIQQSLRRLSLASAITPDVAESIVGDDASIVVEVATRLGFFLSTNRGALELHPLLRSFLISKFNKDQDDPNGQLVSIWSRTLLEHEAWDEALN